MERTNWNEDRIKNSLLFIVGKTKQTHMPTHSEMIEFYGDNRLSNAVRRHGGTNYWASVLGLEMKDCESKSGADYESIFCEQVFAKTGLEPQRTKPRYPYDVLVGGSVKVDVKSGVRVGKTSKYFSFNLEKKEQTCDVFVVYCLNDNYEQEKVYVIPANVLSGKTQLSFGIVESKYDIYLDRWDIISKCYDFWEGVGGA